MTDERSAGNPAEDVAQARWELLTQIDDLLDPLLDVLAFVWIGLLIVDFTRGLGQLLQLVTYGIWALFILDFVIEILIAPKRITYLRHHWLTALSLLLPALRPLRVIRVLRIFRLARAARPAGLLRLLTSLNRTMRTIRRTISRHGIKYVAVLTIIVIFAGAAGMYYFESPAAVREAGVTGVTEAGGGLHSYGEAIWWTAMLLTTLGSEYWPKTAEGRILAFLLAVYGFGIFGYITATIASHFIGVDMEPSGQAGNPARADSPELTALHDEIRSLRLAMTELLARLDTQAGAPQVPGEESNQ